MYIAAQMWEIAWLLFLDYEAPERSKKKASGREWDAGTSFSRLSSRERIAARRGDDEGVTSTLGGSSASN